MDRTIEILYCLSLVLGWLIVGWLGTIDRTRRYQVQRLGSLIFPTVIGTLLYILGEPILDRSIVRLMPLIVALLGAAHLLGEEETSVLAQALKSRVMFLRIRVIVNGAVTIFMSGFLIWTLFFKDAPKASWAFPLTLTFICGMILWRALGEYRVELRTENQRKRLRPIIDRHQSTRRNITPFQSEPLPIFQEAPYDQALLAEIERRRGWLPPYNAEQPDAQSYLNALWLGTLEAAERELPDTPPSNVERLVTNMLLRADRPYLNVASPRIWCTVYAALILWNGGLCILWNL